MRKTWGILKALEEAYKQQNLLHVKAGGVGNVC
jgi:hypothetical protein